MRVRVAVIHREGPNDYVTSIERIGAEPVVLDWTRTTSHAVLDDVHGILLTGGPDVAPARYGETPHPTYEPADANRDDFEAGAIAHALAHDVPLLAICRGAQILNVTCGGTLWQDVPSQYATPLAHKVATPRDGQAHTVDVAHGSRLAHLRGQEDASRPLGVNSRHHQAVKDVASDFVVCARAADGIIEAIERPASQFCVGVQWHPENFLPTGEFDWLFRGFVAHCRAR